MVLKKELTQVIQNNIDGRGIAILSKTDGDAALNVLTNGTSSLLIWLDVSMWLYTQLVWYSLRMHIMCHHMCISY